MSNRDHGTMEPGARAGGPVHRAARVFLLVGLCGLLASFYPPEPGASPPFYGDVAVMTLDMDIDTLGNLIGARKTFIFYFLPTCPHCRDAAPVVAKLARKYGDRLQFLGVAPGRGRLSDLRAFAKEFGLTFPIVQDSGSIFGGRNGLKGTPAYLLTDGSPVPPVTLSSFTPDMETVLQIAILRYLGEDPMALLEPGRYQGAQVCATCHRETYLSWSLTPHAASLYALVRSGKHTKPECVRCHALGAGEPGGFQDVKTTPWLADVGCEACHGRAGGHGAPRQSSTGTAEQARARISSTCSACHDSERPIRPGMGEALRFVSHTHDRDVSRPTWVERRKQLLEGRVSRPMMAPPAGQPLGAEACRDCHRAAYDGWSRSQHARAMDSLKEAEKAPGSACLRCHATVRQAPPEAGPTLLPGVQCEACHGPGTGHVAARGGSQNILALQGLSPTCVIGPRCITCHDEENDPGFDIGEALKRLEAFHQAPIAPPRATSAE